ncbi:unnamed protein product, partial [Rotaria socialis]
VLRNHRTDAQCPACSRPLGDYQIENYTYLSPIHYISRLLSTFTDVNECHTCKEFTTVKSCSECSKDQCHSCSAKHEETHLQIEEQPNENLELSNEELE